MASVARHLRYDDEPERDQQNADDLIVLGSGRNENATWSLNNIETQRKDITMRRKYRIEDRGTGARGLKLVQYRL